MAKLVAPPSVVWKNEPDEHDYPAAGAYLSLIADAKTVADMVGRLRAAPLVTGKAKDLLRASCLPLLALDNVHVLRDLRKVVSGQKLSPVLVVRGDVRKGHPMTVADGYHRVCASYHLDENTDIPARIIDLV